MEEKSTRFTGKKQAKQQVLDSWLIKVNFELLYNASVYLEMQDQWHKAQIYSALVIA